MYDRTYMVGLGNVELLFVSDAASEDALLGLLPASKESQAIQRTEST